MTYIKYRENGEVTMISENKQNGFIKVNCDLSKIKQGYKVYYINGSIEYRKPKELLNKEEFDIDAESVTKATDIKELKDIILKLLTKIYK